MAKMKPDELEALLSAQQSNAVGALGGSIGAARSGLMDRYNGEPYGDEVQDRTSVVDTSVRDTIESIKPELMDIFTGGDAVVQFDPVGGEDVDAAKQETEVCNHVFMQQNNGFMVLYSWFTDAMMVKTGYIKRYWDERKWVDVEEYDDLSPEEAALLLDDLQSTSDEIEFLERAGGVDEETGSVEPMYLKVKRTATEKRYTIENVPPEEILVHPQWSQVNFTGCPFVAHRRPITVSDLIEMGFDRKQVENLPSHDGRLSSDEAETRFSSKNYDENEQDESNPAMREVLVFENYVRADRDGDGVAELLQVFTGGQDGQILKRNGKLAIERVGNQPFEALCPLPIPHKHFGLSIADLVVDLARIKTVLTRQLLDNIIISNNPDLEVNIETAIPETFTDLKVTQPGRVVRTGATGTVTPIAVQGTAPASLSAIEYVDALKEQRTGVTRYNQGLDADSLNKTATGVKNIMSAAQKKILLIARIFAETGVKSLFLNMHRDLRNGPVKEIGMRLNNEWVTINPRTWKHRADMTVNVGLGTGDRDVQFARLGQILVQQKEAMQAGILGYQHMYHTLGKLTELAGFKDVSSFWPDPKQVAQALKVKAAQPEKPDPLIQLQMMDLQMRSQAAQQKSQIDAMKVQMDRMKLANEKAVAKAKSDNDRLKTLMQDDRERDLAAAKIEADEAARMQERIDGQALTDAD